MTTRYYTNPKDARDFRTALKELNILSTIRLTDELKTGISKKPLALWAVCYK